MTGAPLLAVDGLRVDFKDGDGSGCVVPAVDGVSFTIDAGEAVGLVGESGCGKSVTALSLLRLLPPGGRIVGGSIRFRGIDLMKLSAEEMRKRRGAEIAMVFQEPAAALDPVFTIADQVGEALEVHRGASRRQARSAAIGLLERVGIPEPARRADAYPHELSGGMRQRVCIAMALACKPALLLADEPTTALDVTVQAQILALLDDLRRELGMAILLISHDLAVVGGSCDRIAVMYAGKIVEQGPAARVLGRPVHPYTRGLLASRPRLDRALAPGARLPAIPGSVPDPRDWPPGCRFHPRCALAVDACRESVPPLAPVRGAGGALGHVAACPVVEATPEGQVVAPIVAPDRDAMTGALLEVSDLRVGFPVRRGLFGRARGEVRAVDGVSFTIAPGETLGLVGESGCGKTTLGRAILRLVDASAGSVRFDGRDVLAARGAELKALRRAMQIVFQDPWASLNPRMSVGAIVAEGLEIHDLARGAAKSRRVAELLEQVGLPSAAADRFPHEFSGGQRQRIGIARALAVDPRFVVCDEAVSALDVSVQAQVLNLLLDLREQRGLSYLFISHDLAVVRAVSRRVAVMHVGEIVEIGPADEVLTRPRHPYTQALLAAVPRPAPPLPPDGDDSKIGNRGSVGDGEGVRAKLVLQGEPPSPIDPPSGCRFHPRCGFAQPECRTAPPPTRAAGPGHEYRCIL